jgi:hypothetical protein
MRGKCTQDGKRSAARVGSLDSVHANFRPFSLDIWVGGGVGIIGRELWYDQRLLLRADIDFCLQSLLHDRIVLVDGRFSFIHKVGRFSACHAVASR